MHTDPLFHCADGACYNLVRNDYAGIALQLKPRLNDGDYKRLNFSELCKWFDTDAKMLNMRYLSETNVKVHMEELVARRVGQKFLIAVVGNTHTIGADTGRNEYPDVATGMTVPITAPDALWQLGVSGFTSAVIIELKDQRQKKRMGKKLTADEKRTWRSHSSTVIS